MLEAEKERPCDASFSYMDAECPCNSERNCGILLCDTSFDATGMVGFIASNALSVVVLATDCPMLSIAIRTQATIPARTACGDLKRTSRLAGCTFTSTSAGSISNRITATG